MEPGWLIIRAEDAEDYSSGLEESLVNCILDFCPIEPLCLAATICRRWKRLSDRHPLWRRLLKDAGTKIETATVSTSQLVALDSQCDAKISGVCGSKKGGMCSIPSPSDKITGAGDNTTWRTVPETALKLPPQSYRVLYLVSQGLAQRSSTSPQSSDEDFRRRLLAIIPGCFLPGQGAVRSMALKLTLTSGAFVLMAPVCVNGVVSMMFCSWQQQWIIWAIRSLVAEYTWCSACTAGAFVFKQSRDHGAATRVFNASMAAMAGYLSHLAFVCLL